MSKQIKTYLFLICLICFTNHAWAVKAKIRFLFPVVEKNITDGFEDSNLQTSEFVLAFLMPLSRDTQLDIGYSYFNARIKDPETVPEAYTGVFRAHLLELGAGYSGFKLTRTISLIFDASVRIPVSGQAEVKGIPSKSEAKSISGMGYFISSGVAYGKLEVSVFYQHRDLSFDSLTVSRNSETKDVAIHTTEYGIGFGYTF